MNKLEDFPSHSTDKLRYADTDRQGHVNNVAFAAFLETGRVELIEKLVVSQFEFQRKPIRTQTPIP